MREWIYGKNPVFEVLRAARRRVFRVRIAQTIQEKGQVPSILQLCMERGISIERMSPKQLDNQAIGNQGVLAEVSGYPYVSINEILDACDEQKEPALILILDTLQDPQNLGTLLRTAEVIGVNGVVMPLRHTAKITPAVVKASSGACEHLLISQANLAQGIKSLKEKNIWIIGLEPEQSRGFLDNKILKESIALIVGSEGEGIRQLVRDSCDMFVSLPMRGRIDSLNAATAGSIMLYFVWQARDFQ